MPGIAVTCDAEIAVVGKSGARVIQAADFFQGALTTALDVRRDHHRGPAAGLARAPALGLSGIRAPARRFRHGGGGRVLRPGRDGQARNAHVGVIGVGDRPLRLAAVEAVLNGHVVDEATIAKAEAAAVAPRSIRSDDIHASAAYRRALVGTMVERALKARRAQPDTTMTPCQCDFEVNGKPVERRRRAAH